MITPDLTLHKALAALVLSVLLAFSTPAPAEPEPHAVPGPPAWITEKSRVVGDLAIGIGHYIGLAPAIESAYFEALVSILDHAPLVLEDQKQDGMIVSLSRRRIALGTGIVCYSTSKTPRYAEPESRPTSGAATDAPPVEDHTVEMLDRYAGNRIRYQMVVTMYVGDLPLSYEQGCEIENAARLREQVPIRETFVQPRDDAHFNTFVRIEVPMSQLTVLLHEPPLNLPVLPRSTPTMHLHPFQGRAHSPEESPHTEDDLCQGHDWKEGVEWSHCPTNTRSTGEGRP